MFFFQMLKIQVIQKDSWTYFSDCVQDVSGGCFLIFKFELKSLLLNEKLYEIKKYFRND